MNNMRRVVITGMGSISSLGANTKDFIKGLNENKSGVKTVDNWNDFTGLNSRVAAPAIMPNIKIIPRITRRTMGRTGLLAALSAKEATEQANLNPELLSSGKCGCIMGSTMGGAESLYEAFEIMLPEKDLSLMPSTQFFKCVSHTAVMNTAKYLGISGVVMATSAACASSLQAIGLGYDLIRSGRQNIMVCGGAEETHVSVTGSFDVLFATSAGFNDKPEMTPRPFDKDRDGLVCGEAGATIVIEEYEHAIARHATIYGELIGYATCGSGAHVSQSNADAIKNCISLALEDANITSNDVDYINAHATATLQGDPAEVSAIKEIFGNKVPVSSLKGYLGHTLAASGCLEFIASLNMMKEGKIYSTRNFESASDDCKGVMHVKNNMNKNINIFLKNCFAFGGINAVLICKKYKE